MREEQTHHKLNTAGLKPLKTGGQAAGSNPAYVKPP